MKHSKISGLLLVISIFFTTSISANNGVAGVQELRAKQWLIVNDSVMGGVSNSQLIDNDNFITFEGNLSTANNGGFASTRMKYEAGENDNKLEIKIRGDGKEYQLRLRVDNYYDGPAFVSFIQTEKDKWQTITLSKEDFQLMYRGRLIKADYQLAFADVTTVGFLISKKQTGPFKLDIREINWHG